MRPLCTDPQILSAGSAAEAASVSCLARPSVLLPGPGEAYKERSSPGRLDGRSCRRSGKITSHEPSAGVICRVRGTGHSFHGPGSRSTGRKKYVSDLQVYRAAYRNRTDDLRITRGTIPSRAHASCTDSTDHRINGIRRAGTIQGPVPRTVPRPRRCVTLSCSLCVTSPTHSHQDSQHAAGARSVIAYRGLADCGKACQLGMTPRREQPVARLMTKRTLPTRCGSSPPTLTAA